MKNSLSVLILLIAFSSCKKNSLEKADDSKFVRIWHDTVQTMTFNAELEIKANKTFKYQSGGCEFSSESNGIWRTENDTIILKSTKPKDCRFQNRFSVYCIKNNDKSYLKNNKTIEGCEPNGDKPEYEIFENEKFIVKNDTLIHINQAKNDCGVVRVAFSQKKKVM